MAISRFRLSEHPWIISLILLVALTAWLISKPSNAENAIEETAATLDVPLAKVQVDRFESEAVARHILLYGRTAPDRQATLGAEVAGQVEERLVTQGQRVEAGQELIKLEAADRVSQLRGAQALVNVRQKEYDAARSLRSRGLQGDVAVSQAQANVVEARARLRAAQLAVEHTVIKAPFDGIVERIHVQPGDFLGVGDPVALVVDLDPLIVNADVSERHIHQVSEAQPAKITLLNDQTYDAVLRYQATVSSETTNTYAIELAIDNPEMALTAGMSATVDIELESREAVKLAPSALALDEAGNLGVKTLSNDDTVLFVPIDIVKVEPNGVWLAGLGDSVEVITVGQGFVRDGDSVIAQRGE
uniref:efflux RND transporter periplasmic adaptor subunit n=1 Tax=Thaumasiovibrio occultus TaxID=1891184 RepID=UPI000B350470|nr:efflux RND transporter periplasmic adaptor subunit [Thaumasiovibrio occultus]